MIIKTRQTLPVIILLALCLLFSGPAHADNGRDDLLFPSSAWLIGPSSLTSVSAADTGTGLPCIMMNQYNNGYVMRISGGGGRIMAMAIDFRQNVFEHGKDYRINLRIAQQGFDITFPAYAYNKQSLLFGTKEASGLYKALKKAKALDVKIGDKTVTFAMAGIKDGMARMEQCYNGSGQNEGATPQGNIRQARSALPVLDGRANGAIEQDSDRKQSSDKEVVHIDSEDEKVLIPMPPASSETGDEKQTETAFDIERALAKASGQISSMEPSAGQEYDAVPAKAEKTATEMDTDKHAQRAGTEKSQAPEGRNMARHWQSPYDMTGGEEKEPGADATIRRHSRQDILIMPPVDPDKRFDRPFAGKPVGEDHDATKFRYGSYAADKKDVSQSEAIRRWRAIGGANLRETLYNWSREANVRLLWEADRDFPVEESFVVQGSYEEAVTKILNQYRNGDRDADSIPAGRLYHDPAADQKVLMIDMP